MIKYLPRIIHLPRKKIGDFKLFFSSYGTLSSSVPHSQPLQSPNDLFFIREDPVLGHEWAAAKSLKAGTILLDELPSLVAPKWKQVFANKPLICFSCGESVEEYQKCSNCGWPLCSKSCGSIHMMNECKIFAQAKIKFPPPGFKMSDIFSFIALLRVANLKNINPSQYEQMMNLQSHKILPHTNTQLHENARQCSEALGRLLEGYLDTSHDYETIYRVINVNAFTYEGDSGGFKVVYPKACRINHSCSPNCSATISPPPNFTMRICTAVDVKEGDPLTIFYNSTINEFSTRGRQSSFRDLNGSGFVCECSRCLDSTENGTMMNAVTCVPCRDELKSKEITDPHQLAYFLPQDPLNLDFNTAKWKCSRCDQVKLESEILEAIVEIGDELTECNDLPTCEKFIQKYEDRLHPNHFIFQTAIEQIVSALEEKGRFKDLIKYYMYQLNIQDKILPGINLERGELLLKASSSILTLLRKEKRKGETGEEFMENYNLCKEMQEEALLCYENEWPNYIGTFLPDKGYVEKLIRVREELLTKDPS